ncbi:hypothetical protein [Leptolyngbya ohadii]|uniref:hypothetical protein n=1 Tax=Leptolyngbya ohadii TaxID=1962290 RepID=UPI0015C58F2A|nr:hypothetical protein [Leptolyngbya ohadii]
MKWIEIEPLAIEIKGDDYIRRCNIKRFDGTTLKNQKELWFQFSRSLMPPDDTDCDSYLLSVIMMAMQEDRNIHVKGKVSHQLLSNLIEYQAAWNKWLPGTYRCVEITVDEIKEDEVAVPGAVCAFSGGVDATFSVWRHSQKRWSYRSQDIQLCSLVHGFDIPLSDEATFRDVKKKAGKTLQDIQLGLVPIRTNYRSVINVNWEHIFSCALTATLSNFKNVAGTCIIGSSEPYNSLVIPWGSSPITDHLLSSGTFKVIHDGASHSRTEKVKEITDWEVGVQNLRVCWEGGKDSNCGKCEKCLRTKLNFLATTSSVPGCFPNSTISDDLNNVVLRNEAVRAEWRQIYEYAKEHNIHDPWVKQISKVLSRRSQIFDRISTYKTRSKKFLRYILKQAH